MNDEYNVLAGTEVDFSDELSDIATKLEYFNNNLMTKFGIKHIHKIPRISKLDNTLE